MNSAGDSRADRSAKRCRRVVIAGTGGQGVLTAARLLSDVFVERGHEVVSGQLHGMAQRGGSVQASVIIDGGISPVIPRGRADIVLGLEPVETARMSRFLSSRTLVLMNTRPVVPFILGQRAALNKADAEYPSVEGLAAHLRCVSGRVCCFDATRIAEEAGSVRALNMVALGSLLGSGELPCPVEEFRQSVSRRMPPALAEINNRAFVLGAALGKTLAPCRVPS